jgi:Ca-activated chloride channel family protein
MSEFHFLRPWWFLALLPVAWLLIALWRRRASGTTWGELIDAQLLSHLWLEPPGRVARLPLWLLGSGWLLTVLALAGPVWERQPEPVWQTQASRILILDLSPSMDLADLPPSRLERARFKITDILARSREGRSGLVVFAAEPHTVTPLTDDDETIANLLSALSTEIMPVAGDAGAPALRLAGALLARTGVQQGELLLLTDGLADPGAALAAARQLRAQGHRLSVLGVGTLQGAPMPKAGGGFAGMARLPIDSLRELARAGGGAYSGLRVDDRDLTRVLREPRQSAPFAQTDDSGVERWIERGAWLLPMLLLLAAAGFRRGWLAGLLVILVLPPPLHAFEWRDFWLRKDQQAAQALQQGQPAVAAERFEDPAWRATALYQAGEYAQAAEAFAAAPGTDAIYNRGNALARAGHLQEAAEAYRQALGQDPAHADARANLELVEQLLQQQSQAQSSSQGDPTDQQASSEQPSQPAADGGQDQPQQDGEEQQARQAEGQRQGEQEQSTESSEPQTAAQTATDSGQDEQQAGQTPQPQDQAGESFTAQAPQPDQDEAGQAQASEQAEEDTREAARQDVLQQTPGRTQEAAAEPPSEAPLPAVIPAEQSEPIDEKDLALQQWLRQIPEDPAGLLRRKFMVEHLERMRKAE